MKKTSFRIGALTTCLTLTYLFLAGCQSKPRKETAEAVKSLAKIEAAVQVGVNYQQYGNLLIDAMALVNEAKLLEGNGNVSDKLSAIIDAYVDARKVWERKLASGSFCFPATDGPSTEDRKLEANLLRKRLNNGERFEALARKFSQDGTRESAGDLGWFARNKMDPDFERVAFSLQKGETSEVIETKHGYHIVRVDDRRGSGEQTEVRARHIFISNAPDIAPQQLEARTIALKYDISKVSPPREPDPKVDPTWCGNVDEVMQHIWAWSSGRLIELRASLR